jgi:hypothetical protein
MVLLDDPGRSSSTTRTVLVDHLRAVFVDHPGPVLVDNLKGSERTVKSGCSEFCSILLSCCFSRKDPPSEADRLQIYAVMVTT